MNWSNRIRQTHRWLAVFFTVTVVGTAVALSLPEPIVWVSYIPLLPLALMFFSGIFLFVHPYAAKRRGGAVAEK